MVHDGVRNLLHQPEFGDVGRFQEVLDLLEEERVLGEMLAAIETDHGTQIMIGRETGLEQLRQCSLVMTTYRVGAQRWGTLGVPRSHPHAVLAGGSAGSLRGHAGRRHPEPHAPMSPTPAR